MRRQFTKIALAATLGFGLVLTISCGGENMDELPCMSCEDDPPLDGYILSSSSYSSSDSGEFKEVEDILNGLDITPSSSYFETSSSSVVMPSSSSGTVTVVSCDISDYRTVQIGSQTWMAENLNCDVAGSKCYGNNPANCTTYGRLYDWATAMALSVSCNNTSCYSQIGVKHKGICPYGWHIPSGSDWDILMAAVGGSSTAGIKLKTTSGWNSYTGAPIGTNEFGFSALPGGLGISSGGFVVIGYDGYWWSSSEYNSNNAYFRLMDCSIEESRWNNIEKSYLFSVRCLKD